MVQLPIFGDADTEEAWVGKEHIGCQRGVAGVQEGAGDGRRVEHVPEIGHRLPAILIGEDQGQIHVRISVQLVIRLVDKDPYGKISEYFRMRSGKASDSSVSLPVF